MMIDFNILWPKYGIKPYGVLHVGANTGQEAEFYYNAGVKEVIWVEGHPETFKKLQSYVKDIPGSVCINACVSDRYSETTFNIANNESQSSSLLQLGNHKDIHPEVEFIDSMSVKTYRLDHLLRDFDIKGYWFLNVDVQGMDLFAIKGLGTMLEKFRWINSEVNKTEVYKGCSLIGEMDEYLSGFGFVRTETGDWVCDSWTDALYIKQ